ncbi:hypothetical protein ACJMK2_043610 [Sinanodonta woodiana]|uniref:KY-like immunoglobulin-like domain-containing protein n=1 Tax=Sinanodonta woodiana TaxID=1069815 RepID=A0ABD3W0A0_SINWO
MAMSSNGNMPEIRPPPNRKKDIFDPQKMVRVDERAREAPFETATTFPELVKYLTTGLVNDVEKVRALFMWMGSHQHLSTVYWDASEDSPIGCWQLQSMGRLSYNDFFVRLCKEANLPCVAIQGVVKAMHYAVGMRDEELKSFQGEWVAVYVAKGWRLIVPIWAFSAVAGFTDGNWMEVERDGEAVFQRDESFPGQHITHLNDDYFLTDPNRLIFECFPEKQEWQLLKEPWSFEKFADVPLCHIQYFEQDMSIIGKFSGRLKSENGKCEIKLKEKPGMFFGYRLFYNVTESGKELSNDTKLDRYVLYKTESGTFGFEVRFAAAGVYKLQVNGGVRRDTFDMICEFRMTCDEPMKDCRPLPINPLIGFGPNSTTKEGGLKAESHTQAVVNFRKEEGTTITFKILKPVNVQTRLFHNEISSNELQKCIDQQPWANGKQIRITVLVPQSGEYALQINTRDEDHLASDAYENVCNYLLTNDNEDTAPQKVKEKMRAMRDAKQRVVQMDPKKIEAITKIKIPSKKLHDIMMATLLMIGKWEGFVKDWAKVCKVLEIKGNQSVQSRVRRFRVKTADTDVCFKARSICENYFDDENASDDADAQDTFCDWVQKAVVAKETVSELENYLPPGTDYEDDVFISSDEA